MSCLLCVVIYVFGGYSQAELLLQAQKNTWLARANERMAHQILLDINRLKEKL